MQKAPNQTAKLELRPSCELCDKDLPLESKVACNMYVCTFGTDCIEEILKNVCLNCGGGFVSRPIRPKTERRQRVSLAHHLTSTKRVNKNIVLTK